MGILGRALYRSPWDLGYLGLVYLRVLVLRLTRGCLGMLQTGVKLSHSR